MNSTWKVVIAVSFAAALSAGLLNLWFAINPQRCDWPALSSVPQQDARTKLAVGYVPAHCIFVNTGIDVFKGEAITGTATGHWWDWFRFVDQAGYHIPLWLIPRRYYPRRKEENFFQLMGVIDDKPTGDLRATASARDGNAFRMSANTPHTAQSSGRLYLFANDSLNMYWNNWGEIRLVLTHGEQGNINRAK